MYKYTYIGQAKDAAADPNANSAGVSEDERGGIKPSSDNVLFAGVLSEAHMKLAMIAGVECLFRIASVRYGENGRSRLVVHTKTNGTWSAPTPVDFPLGFGEGDVERSGIFDYDFDVVEYTAPPATTPISIRRAHPACCPLCVCASATTEFA